MVRIGGDPTVHEVILSGGDPLILGDSSLLEIVNRLARIPHVMRFRLHTRLPIMIPSRVTESLVAGLAGTRLRPLVVIHTNHPAEINGLVGRALNRFTAGGIMLLSQTVLLRDVNDQLETLTELFERLVQWRIIPYYLHQLDRVAGAAHFEVPEETGIRLVQELRARLPGYAVPRYVRETPLGPCKEVIA